VSVYRLAVIGLNHYHVTGWVESLEAWSDRIEIVALYDADPALGERLAPSHHDPILAKALPAWCRDLPFYTDLDTLIAEVKPDLALITLQNIDMPAAIARLADAGVHMVVDKPGGRTAAEARPALEAIERNNVKVTVGLNRRNGHAWQDVRKMIEAGRIGRLMTTEAVFTTSSVKVRDPKNPIFDPVTAGGGILHWLGVHDLDLLLWLTGEQIVELHAMSGTLSGEDIKVEDVISMSVRYENGAIGSVHYSYAFPRAGANDGYVAFRGTGGSIKIQSNGTVTWFGPGNRDEPHAAETTTYELGKAPGYGPLASAGISDLLDAIEQDRQPLANYAQLVAVLEVIDAAYQSAKTGQRVQVG
jgi:predicted dehydrogenase